MAWYSAELQSLRTFPQGTGMAILRGKVTCGRDEANVLEAGASEVFQSSVPECWVCLSTCYVGVPVALQVTGAYGEVVLVGMVRI